MLLSAFFSASETALFSIPRERILFYKKNVKKRSLCIYSLLKDGQQTLLCILLGNLFVNITLVGLIHELISSLFPKNSFSLTLIVSTSTILAFGEILPKNIALRWNETIAAIIALPLFYLIALVRPVLILMQKLNTSILTWFTRHLRKPSPYVTLNELKSGISQYTHDGTISKNEQFTIDRLLETGILPVSKMMTHRSQIIFINPTSNKSEIINLLLHKKKTFCLIRDAQDKNEISGIVYLSDILSIQNESEVLKIMVPPVWIPESLETVDCIHFMLEGKHSHVCLVDEFGTFSGVLSLSKCIEHLLNKLQPLKKSENVQNKNVRCFSGLDELEKNNDWVPPSMKKLAKTARTMNGLITSYLGKIPKMGEKFAIDGWTFYIIEGKENFIESVIIKKKD